MHSRCSRVCSDEQGSYQGRRKIHPRARGIALSKAAFLARTVDEAVGACGNLPDSGGCLKHGILVVEDNQLNCELLCDWLEVEGYEGWSTADLKASYEVFAKRLPDAVLLDINLGAANGLDRVPWMRQKPELGEIPGSAVTAHALVGEQE